MPDLTDVRERDRLYMLKIRKENRWRRITRMLDNGSNSFDIKDAVDDYADAKHEYEQAREAE